MPYQPQQVRLFQMIAHGKAAQRRGLSETKARSLLQEAGQQHETGMESRRARLAGALDRMRSAGRM